MLQTETAESGRAKASSREELLARAEALVPTLRERAEASERMRTCPAESIQDFISNGLLRICQPARYGGYELGYDVLCEVAQTLARGDGSQAWVHMVLADNPLKLAAYSLEAQHDVWGENPDARIAVAIAQVGKARPVEGGVKWSGVHGFSSGIDHAGWVMCGGHVYEDGAEPRACFALIPTSEVTIVDDWHVLGLVGTGSKSFEVRDVFVPAHRLLDKKAADEGTAPGTLFHQAPIFKLPRGGVSAASYTAVAVGVAEGFLAEYCAQTARRTSRGNVVAEQPGIQIDIGRSSAEIEAAARMYLGAVREAMATLAKGEQVSRAQNLLGKRNACYAAQLAFTAVQRLFNDAGGRALYASNVLQRQFRDVYAASAHHSLVWHTAAGNYGRHLLGLDRAE